MSSDALKEEPSETEEFASAPEDAESDQAEDYSEVCENITYLASFDVYIIVERLRSSFTTAQGSRFSASYHSTK